MKKLRHKFHQVFTQVSHNPSLINNSHFLDQLQFDISHQLLKILAFAQGIEPKVSPRYRIQALKKAQDYISNNAHKPITVRELCKTLQISERTLQYTFRNQFGVSPKSYLKAFRLNQVYKILRSADPLQTKVTDIANDWGFWHMGQFAADYRQLFTELPSQTLRSNSS